MSIIGIGLDIIEIHRIETIIKRSGDRLAKKILRITEWQQYQHCNKSPNFLAKRFAVKEAAAKAFGIGMRKNLFFNHFEVQNNSFGKPFLTFFSKAKDLADLLKIKKVFVSITDEKKYAFAIVILEK